MEWRLAVTDSEQQAAVQKNNPKPPTNVVPLSSLVGNRGSERRRRGGGIIPGVVVGRRHACALCPGSLNSALNRQPLNLAFFHTCLKHTHLMSLSLPPGPKRRGTMRGPAEPTGGCWVEKGREG